MSRPSRAWSAHYPPVTLADLQLAAKLAEQIAALEVAPLNGGHWRLFRVFHLYLEARAIRDNMDRLHQYCRCIDGLIVSKQGESQGAIQEPDGAVHRPAPSTR